LYWCMGQSPNSYGNDNRISYLWQLHRLCWSLGWSCIGFRGGFGGMVRWVNSLQRYLVNGWHIWHKILGWTSVFASEATFFVVLVDYWADGVIPEAALRKYPNLSLKICYFPSSRCATVTIFLVICLVVFLVPNKYFGWVEYFGSLVKVFLFIFITLISLAIIGGAGPSGYVRDGSTWTTLPVFKNGFGVSSFWLFRLFRIH
jgi:hypothetical protein